LHSIIPAPVFSRSCFTAAAVISAMITNVSECLKIKSGATAHGSVMKNAALRVVRSKAALTDE
jgi:hypothetical protein